MTVVKFSNVFNEYCVDVFKKYKIPALAMGMAKDGEPLWENQLGYRNVEQKLPVTSDTVFGIGSITKSFSCMAIMQLQEAGKLSVHDPVSKYLPAFKTPNDEWTKQMSIHHFMTHTAGLPPLSTLFGAMKRSMDLDPKIEGAEENATEQEAPSNEISAIDTFDELLEYMANEDYALLGAPGEEFSYSNDCHALLGMIIEKVSGQSYETYMKEFILEPIGMTNSVFHYEELSSQEDIAILYNSYKKDGETIVYESNNPWDAPTMRAAGFLKSTVNDMLKYAEVFRNGGKVGTVQVISKDSVDQMTAPHVQSGPGRYYGYGLMITPDFFGYKLVEHGGGIKGVSAQMSVLPELGLTGISLTNLGGVPSSKLLYSAFADYLGKPAAAPAMDFEAVEISKESLKAYEGLFRSGEGANLTFAEEDGKLVVSSSDIASLPAKYVGKDLFLLYLNEDNVAIRFVRDEDGAVIRVAFGFRQIPKVLVEEDDL